MAGLLSTTTQFLSNKKKKENELTSAGIRKTKRGEKKKKNQYRNYNRKII